jgi:hypothetical protein
MEVEVDPLDGNETFDLSDVEFPHIEQKHAIGGCEGT